jgi:hypothetical protein
MNTYFTKAEAVAKVGNRIRTNTAWAGVPAGSSGKVIGCDSMGQTKQAGQEPGDVWDVVVEWELDAHNRPLTDWFTGDECEHYLEEVA